MTEAVGTDPYARARGEIIAERGTVVPPWAKPIKNFNVRVKEMIQGSPCEIPPGFTIGEVAPEFRWAIDPDTGVILDQAEFRMQYDKWYAAHYIMRNRKVEGEVVDIPSVREFVCRKVDPNDPTKIVPMDYDPDRPVVFKPKLLYDRDGENPISAEEAKARRQSDKAGAQMEMLIKLHQSGKLTLEEFAEESAKVFGGSVVIGQDGADSSKAEAIEPPPGFEPKAEIPDLSDALVPMTKTLCGAMVKVRGKHLHELRCGECAKIREAQEV